MTEQQPAVETRERPESQQRAQPSQRISETGRALINAIVEGSPAVVTAPLTVPTMLLALTILILLRCSPRSLLGPLPPRLRAPPLP